MATTIQHNPVLLQQQHSEDEDVALASFLSNSLRFDQSQDYWNYTQPQTRQQHRTRSRVSSNSSQSINLQKSTSTPISSNTINSRHNNGRKISPSSSSSRSYNPTNSPSLSSSEPSQIRRKSVNSMTSLQQQQRRPSTTSSVTSFTSEVSAGTKQSFSRKLRKVFSMNNLRSPNTDLASLAENNNSSTSVASSIQFSKSVESSMSFRRRSIASLSSLFQKGNNSTAVVDSETTKQQYSDKKTASRRHSSGDLRHLAKEDKKRPDLRVDTSETTSHAKKGALKARSTNNSTIIPDSPNSVISSRSSFSRLPPPQQRHFSQEPGLPSPTPSNHEDELIKPSLGLYYGIGLHGSPRLKPATSSTSSLITTERRIQFCSTIHVHETFCAGDYDRRCDNNATCQKLTPIMAMKIKQELNEYKLSEMDVHVESRQYTHFFL